MDIQHGSRLTTEEKKRALQKIEREIAECSVCKEGKTGLPVPGAGNPDARVCFIGEAPGKKEAVTGKPFIGRSGVLLRKFIEEIGLRPRDIYITSPVKYLPNSGTPRLTDIRHGALHLQKQLAIINPDISVLLGVSATKALLFPPISLTKMHGHLLEEKGKRYFITYHPAAALRFPYIKKLFKEDFGKLRGIFIKVKE